MPAWHEDPAAVRPMLASTSDAPLVQSGWVYEPKYDGIRALVDLRPDRVRLYSRNGNDKTSQFPTIVTALQRLARAVKTPLLIDGEIVAIDAAGLPLGFQEMQGRIHLKDSGDIARAEAAQPAAIVLFDLLRDGDEDLRGLTLAARRLRLQARVRLKGKPEGRAIRLSEIAADDGRAMMTRARDEGWEGLIAKDGQSRYYSGRRTPSWRKLKLLNTQEFVVGGWTDPRDTRQHFGALLVGTYKDGRLEYAGNVGTGFDEAELARLAGLFAKRRQAASPFSSPIKIAGKPHWITPDLVAELRFTEWTSDGMLRHPVYLGLRDDKEARDVAREKIKLVKTPRPQDSDSLADQLSAIEKSGKNSEVTLPNGDRLKVTNLSKLYWPKLGITKGELLRYYVEVAPLVLPAVDDRPLVMKRLPNGVDQPAFYQQHHPEDAPPGVRREELPPDLDPHDQSRSARLIGGSITTLLYMTQLGAISQDPWFSRVAHPLYQDYTALDLDPGDDVPFARVLDVARWLKEELDRLDIPAVPKTSGASGLHIYIPLPKRTTYESGQLLAQILATLVSAKHPKVATIERMVKKRPRGTVYVDYLQNILGKTLATAYSARASDYAGVSTPLTWKEVAKGVDPRDFTVRTAPARFQKTGDLWAAVSKGPTVNIRAVLKEIQQSSK